MKNIAATGARPRKPWRRPSDGSSKSMKPTERKQDSTKSAKRRSSKKPKTQSKNTHIVKRKQGPSRTQTKLPAIGSEKLRLARTRRRKRRPYGKRSSSTKATTSPMNWTCYEPRRKSEQRNTRRLRQLSCVSSIMLIKHGRSKKLNMLSCCRRWSRLGRRGRLSLTNE